MLRSPNEKAQPGLGVDSGFDFKDRRFGELIGNAGVLFFSWDRVRDRVIVAKACEMICALARVGRGVGVCPVGR